MKIMICGGAGAMAWPAELYMLDQKDLEKLTIADYSQPAMDKRVAALKNDPRLDTVLMDISDIDASAEQMKGYDVVLAMVPCQLTTPAIKAALKAGVNYADMGSFETEVQLALDDDFKKIGKTAALGLGTACGTSYFAPAVVVDEMDSVEDIYCLDACVNIVPHSEHTFPLHWGYSLDCILDEFSADADYMENGVVMQEPARSHGEVVHFLPPAGDTWIAITDHPEVPVWYDTWKDKGLKNAAWKIGYEEDFEKKMRFIVALGFADPDKKVKVGGVEVNPREVFLATIRSLEPEKGKQPDFRGHMVFKIKGVEKGQKVEYFITEWSTPELTKWMQDRGVFSSYRTGTYAAIATVMMARGETTKTGAVYPHLCLSSRDYIKECIRVGIDFTYERRVCIDL